MTDQPITDRGTVRIVAAGLIVIALAISVGLLLVAAFATDLDPEARRGALLTAGTMGTTALGAGAALLASTRNGGATPALRRPAPTVDSDTILPPT